MQSSNAPKKETQEANNLSYNEKIKNFNTLLANHEKSCNENLDALFNIMEDTNLSSVIQQLRRHHQGMKDATSQHELELYLDSFKRTVEHFTQETDIIGILNLLSYFRDLEVLIQKDKDSSSFFNDDSAETKRRQLGWLEIGFQAFEIRSNKLIQNFQEKIKILNLDSENTNQEKIFRLKAGIDEINSVIENFTWIKIKMDALYKAKTPQDLDNARKELTISLLNMEDEFATLETVELNRKFGLAAIKTAESLCATRTFSLPEKSNNLRHAINFAWIGFGIAVCAIGAAITAPVGILVLGITGIVYGVVDLGKELGETFSEAGSIVIGEKEIPKPQMSTPQKIKKVAAKLVSPLLSFALLGLAVCALVFPPLALPLLSVSLFLTVVVGISHIRKVYLEKKAERQAEEKHNQMNQTFVNDLNALKDSPQQEKNLTKKLNKKEEQWLEKANTKQTSEKIPLSTDAKLDLILMRRKIDGHVSEDEKNQMQKSVAEYSIELSKEESSDKAKSVSKQKPVTQEAVSGEAKSASEEESASEEGSASEGTSATEGTSASEETCASEGEQPTRESRPSSEEGPESAEELPAENESQSVQTQHSKNLSEDNNAENLKNPQTPEIKNQGTCTK